jgi:cyclopropane fatty-acyl-phospholipid synthase-like methyltransferase
MTEQQRQDRTPTTVEVGQYYDTLGAFYQILWGDSIHFGYWPDPTDANVSMAQAQALFTELLINELGVQAGQKVLDVGCGTGQPGVQLAQTAGALVTGITVSQTQVAAAQQRSAAAGTADSARFELVNAMELPYADASFDAAWAFESIFHMPSRAQVFREMARVVRPGGRVAVADFVTLRPMTQAEIDIAYPAFAVSEIGSLEGYIDDLKAAGFTNVTCRDVTVNTIRPSNRATLANLQSEPHQEQLRSVYGDAQVATFLGGWDAIRTVNETLAYIVLTADRP